MKVITISSIHFSFCYNRPCNSVFIRLSNRFTKSSWSPLGLLSGLTTCIIFGTCVDLSGTQNKDSKTSFWRPNLSLSFLGDSLEILVVDPAPSLHRCKQENLLPMHEKRDCIEALWSIADHFLYWSSELSNQTVEMELKYLWSESWYIICSCWKKGSCPGRKKSKLILCRLS